MQMREIPGGFCLADGVKKSLSYRALHETATCPSLRDEHQEHEGRS